VLSASLTVRRQDIIEQPVDTRYVIIGTVINNCEKHCDDVFALAGAAVGTRTGWVVIIAPEVKTNIVQPCALHAGCDGVVVDAYAGQTDKAGATYIRHPLRIMEQIDTESERVVAVLHDVVEDANYSLDDIEDNMDLTRLSEVDDEILEKQAVYHQALQELTANP